MKAITIVLADGSVLEIERGRQREVGGQLTIETGDRRIVVPVPGYRMPDVPKRSAGYFAEPGMDPIDLFIGSEGTLGVVTEVTFTVPSRAPSTVLAFVPCATEREGLALVAALRTASVHTWRKRDARGLDIAAIDRIDRRSLEILREDGADRRHNVSLPASTELALLIQIEIDPQITRDQAFASIGTALSNQVSDGPLVRFCRMLDRAGLLADSEIALPGDKRRMEELVALREAVPAGVNQRVGVAKRTVDPRIQKTAADMIVPFERVPEMMALYRREFEGRGLDYAVWGHISDGNVHPNVIPRSLADVMAGKEAILECGREVTRLGGCPLAEHGVGRNPVKQTLLRELYGDVGIDAMRRVKRALDPEWKLAAGVIFQHY